MTSSIKSFQQSFTNALIDENNSDFLNVIEKSQIKNELRMNLYRDSIKGTLHSTLDEIYLQTSILLGSKCFSHLKHQYVQKNACSVKNLDDYGIDFPYFLALEMPEVPYLKDFGLLDQSWHQVFYKEDEVFIDEKKLAELFSQDPETLIFRRSNNLIIQLCDFDIFTVWKNVLNHQLAPQTIEAEKSKNSICIYKKKLEREAFQLTDDQSKLLNGLKTPSSLYKLAEQDDTGDFNLLCIKLVELVKSGAIIPYINTCMIQ